MKQNNDNKINVQIRQPHITIYNFSNNHNSTKELGLNKILPKANRNGNQEKAQMLLTKEYQNFLQLKSTLASTNNKHNKLNKCDNNSLELFTQRRQCAFLRNITSSCDDLNKHSTNNFYTKYNNFVIHNNNNQCCKICQDFFVSSAYPIIFNNLRLIKEKYVSENDANSIDYIIFNVKRRLVAIFKENLIYSDQQEFLKRVYNYSESQVRIRNAVAFYSSKVTMFPTLQRLSDNIYFSKNIEKKEKINCLNKNNKDPNKNKQISTFLKSDFINSLLNEELNQSPSLADSGFCQSEEDLISIIRKIETKAIRPYHGRNCKEFNTTNLKEGIEMIDKAYTTEIQIAPKIKKMIKLDDSIKGKNSSKLISNSQKFKNPSNLINLKKGVVIDSVNQKNSQNMIKQHLTTDNKHEIIKQDLKKIILRPKKSQLSYNLKFPFLNLIHQNPPIIKEKIVNPNSINNILKYNDHLSSSRGSTNFFHNIDFPIAIKKHGSIERASGFPIHILNENHPFKINEKVMSIYNSAKNLNKKSKVIKTSKDSKKIKK